MFQPGKDASLSQCYPKQYVARTHLDPIQTGLDKFLNGRIFTCATHLHGTEQILLQTAVLLAVQKLAWFYGSCVNKMWICAGFHPFQKFDRTYVNGV